VFVQLAFQESKQKSDRVKAAHDKRIAQARAGIKVGTSSLPPWIDVVDDELVLNMKRALVIRRIVTLLCREKQGIMAVVKTLRAERVPTFGNGLGWTLSYISRLFKDVRLIGTYQPITGRRRIPDGNPILDFYPAVISQDEFVLARARINARWAKASGRAHKWTKAQAQEMGKKGGLKSAKKRRKAMKARKLAS
jgi:hypothetical protein